MTKEEKKDNLMLSLFDKVSKENKVSYALLSDSIIELMEVANQENIAFSSVMVKGKDCIGVISDNIDEDSCISIIASVIQFLMRSPYAKEFESTGIYIESIFIKALQKCLK